MNVLVLSPHADDGDLAMGATMAKMSRRGKRVYQALVCASDYKASDGSVVTRAGRALEFEKACNQLQVTAFKFPLLDAENSLDTTPLAMLVQVLEDVIRSCQPDEIYVPLPWFNQDHTRVWEAVQVILRRPPHYNVYAYEMPGQTWPIFPVPPFGWRYENVDGADFEKKMAALTAHRSQNLAEKRGPVSVLGVISHMEWCGGLVGKPSAERFLTVLETRS